ncbi:hypothetical protein [Nonomuraea cypriaca]|nr:hypothetical protein [Nonomuraea cypriaca]
MADGLELGTAAAWVRLKPLLKLLKLLAVLAVLAVLGVAACG